MSLCSIFLYKRRILWYSDLKNLTFTKVKVPVWEWGEWYLFCVVLFKMSDVWLKASYKIYPWNNKDSDAYPNPQLMEFIIGYDRRGYPFLPGNFMCKETEALRGWIICLKTFSLFIAKLEFEPWTLVIILIWFFAWIWHIWRAFRTPRFQNNESIQVFTNLSVKCFKIFFKILLHEFQIAVFIFYSWVYIQASMSEEPSKSLLSTK